MLYHGLLIAGAAALAFALVYQGNEANLGRARTVAFCTIAFAQLFYAVGCRSQRYTMPELGLFSNPQLFVAIAISSLLQLSIVTLPFTQPLFEARTELGWAWALVFLLALTPVTIIEVTKLIRAARRRVSPAD